MAGGREMGKEECFEFGFWRLLFKMDACARVLTRESEKNMARGNQGFLLQCSCGIESSLRKHDLPRASALHTPTISKGLMEIPSSVTLSAKDFTLSLQHSLLKRPW